jgi:hypothetical protein
MWLLANSTPFAAERTWVRTQDGSEVWVVAVKGSFLIESDGTQISDPCQDEVRRIPQFGGSPENSSLLYESDLVYRKHRTDVIVHGHAVWSRGGAVSSVDVRLRVASIDKTLRVHGDRVIRGGLLASSVSSPQPFFRIPPSYERTFGGTDTKDADPARHDWEPRNPVGVGFATREAHVVGTLAPNIEVPGSPYHGWRRGTPAGFGPIARHWMPRVKYAGTYDKQWEETRRPLLPADFDERFYQYAPEDQQVDGYLRGGEDVELHNVTPEGTWKFRLPRVSLVMSTSFYDGTEVEHRPVIHTLIIEPDKRRFQLVWHSHLPCHTKVNKLAKTAIALKKRVNVPDEDRRSGMWIGV